MKYLRCPRCDSDWKIDNTKATKYCSHCIVSYYSGRVVEVFRIRHILYQGDELSWYYCIDQNWGRCYYKKIMASSLEIDLPWLDEKITAEQLKLCLVFS